MWFNKRKKPPVGSDGTGPSGTRLETPKFYKIELEMMKRGNFIRRKGTEMRQCAVTVKGSSRLVTSGDVVDRLTFEALLRYGMIEVPAPKSPPGRDQQVSQKPADTSGA